MIQKPTGAARHQMIILRNQPAMFHVKRPD